MTVQTSHSLPPAAPDRALTEAEARSLTGQIRSIGEAIADRVDLLVDKIRQARDGQAHTALAYKSWPDYVQTEFADVLPRLDREPRRELVAALTETGMSSRAIAPVVRITDRQVRRDAGGTSVPRRAGNVTTIGLDGKRYTPPRPPAPRPAGLAHAYGSAVGRMRREVQSLTRLCNHHQFAELQEDARGLNARKLADAANELLDLLDDLGIDRHQYGALS